MPSIPSTIISLPRMKFNGLEKGEDHIVFRMDPDNRYKPLCSYCDQPAAPNRNFSRKIRDLGCFANISYLEFKYRNVLCKSCGVVVEKLNFVSPHARFTKRLAEAVGKACEHMTISEVADYFSLDWKTVQAIDKYYIKQQLEDLPLDQVRVLGLDEVACRKGHKYFTVIYDLENNRLLRIVEGRTEEAVSQFFLELGDTAREIKAVAVDMWQPYTNAIKKFCPQAKIVYDKFHIVSNYHKLIDKIRRREFREASKEEKELLKGTRYLLLKNQSKLEEKRREKLEKLLEHNKTLNSVYVLKEQLQTLWEHVTVPSFITALKQWCTMAKETEIPELIKFAESLERHQHGLISYCFYPINTASIEAHNYTISSLRRNARGFHDNDYFKLKIFQAINLRDRS